MTPRSSLEPIRPLAEPRERRHPVLLALRDVGSRAASIAIDELERDPAAAAMLRALLARALELLVEIQAIDEPDGDLAESGPDAWFGLDTAADRSRHVGDVCYASQLELRRVSRELIAARDPDDVLIAAESARRKLRRGIRAVLEAAHEAGDADLLGGAHQGQHQIADLAPALVVRRLYATFRRSLRRSDGDSPEAVLTAVRYAGGALATLVTSPDYVELRASDRTVLRRLRERALTWARGERAVLEGQRLLADVWTTADLLRGINRRQELRAHDSALIARLIAGPAGPPSAWLDQLDPLTGLDDELDALCARARTVHPDDVVPDILIRLATLQ